TMIKVLSLFSGIGAFERAFCRIGLDWELVNYCEIDRWASLSYSMVNQCDESLNLRDVRTVTAETVRDRQVDLITYGFPCQDISIAGKQQGFVNDSGESTRSGLFFEALRIIKELRPRYAIAENVKALTSTKFKNEFATVLSSLEEAGYNNYWRVLNAKDYGIPQNRERVFIVSIRRDVDEGDFQFPEKEPLMLRLRDMLEPAESVDEKYYLSTEREGVRRLIAELEARYSPPAVAKTGETPVLCQIGNIAKDPNREHIQDRIYDPSGLAPTLNTVGGGNLEPKITIDGTIGPHETDRITGKDGMVQTLKATDYKNPPKIVIDGLTRDTQKQKARVFNPSGLAASLIATDYKEPPQISVIGQLKGGEKGRVVDRDGIGYTLTATEYKDPLKIAEPVIVGSMQAHAAVKTDGICPTLTEAMGMGGGQVPVHTYGVRIRKLTPRECWRLMGFMDEEFDRVHGISNSQLYKQAGNSIVVNVLSALLSQLFYRELV
ncbi:MAG: DNA (cytosine-5-)-methyltransferase, partial [Paludibacteraceae bacterium]|nr:DNA (cytosine-5-)-methyltransferase [Paludibacteraceae bacterium]